MIAVIADDIAGAAELAGVAALQGYRAEVHTVFDPHANAEMIAVDTDTRWRPAAEAARIVAGITATVLATRPEWIFKKTDSVLRGNVRAEIEAMLSVTGQGRAVLIPANPSKNRVIRDGVYFVNDMPLAQTTFARDPEHPRWTSNVAELLGPADPQDKVLAPDAGSARDIAKCAGEMNADTLPAGGVDFFEAILKATGEIKVRASGHDSAAHSFDRPGPTLFVCGSAAAWDSGRAAECATYGIPVIPMPEQIFNSEFTAAAMDEWCIQATIAMRNIGRAMLAIGRTSVIRSRLATDQLIERLVEVVVRILAAKSVARLCIEGGATAAALLKRFEWTRMVAFASESGDVSTLSVAGGPLLLIKPGSYPWPRAVLN